MSKRVASKENAPESILSKENVRIPRYKEIQRCRVKTNMYLLCKNTTLQGNTVLQSKDKYVHIRNT